MRNSLVENVMSLLGGAGLGAGLMYLFDPDQGDRRREDLRSTAGQAVSTTGDAVGATLHSAADTAKSVAHRISDYAQDMAAGLGDRASSLTSDAGDSARSMASRMGKSARGYGSSAADQARSWRDNLSDQANSLISRARRSNVVVEESHPYATATGITVGTVGVLAIGAGVMYFMDPDRGRSRRAWARDKVTSFTRRTGQQARRYGRHLGNQMKGVAAEAKRVIPDTWREGQSGQESQGSEQQSMPQSGYSTTQL